MKRSLIYKLKEWKVSKTRKPRILLGARQVGKTHLIRDFGKSDYSSVAYFNFEEQPNLKSCFGNSLQPAKCIELLEIIGETKIIPGNTLIFFDEIQRCPEAVTSLKYFCEKSPEHHVICAGSSLGLSLGANTSFPVGKVDFMRLNPLSFAEFATAMGRSNLQEHLLEQGLAITINPAIHSELMDLFSFFLFIGGMPEAVASYVAEKDLIKVRSIQESILQSHRNDFSKYADPIQTLKILRLWESVPQQLSREIKKFIFSAIAKSARAREYELALQWLLDAGLILRSNCCQHAEPPLASHADFDCFRIFALDVGLLGAQVKVSQQVIVDRQTLFTQFNGALFENFVAQELVAHGLSPLYYWTSGAQAELAFLIEMNGQVMPIEVKSGKSMRSRSLLSYIKRHQTKTAIRVSTNNTTTPTNGPITELPVYAIELLKKLA